MNFHPFQGLQDLPDLPDAAHASREDLVAEMLGLQAHPLPGPTPAALRVSDRETPHEDPATRQLLTRRLGVARELLMRELRDRMAQGPVMSSPQVLRDWLRLRCAGLQHEVFLALYLDANHRLITRAGILNKVGHDVPVARITNVAYERSLSDRVFGCGSLVFTTSAEAPVVLTDIPKVEEVGVAISNLLFGVRA